jgi:HEAT repeat protein
LGYSANSSAKYFNNLIQRHQDLVMFAQNNFVNTAIALSSVLTVSLAATVPAFAQTRFSDVDNSYWASEYVRSLATANVIGGFPDGTFQPDQQMTRAQFASILAGAFPQPTVREPIRFSDVPADHWAAGAISTAYARGFLSGYPDGTFGIDQPITRLEVLVALTNGLKIQPAANTDEMLNAFTDRGQIPAWASETVATATQNQVVVNYPNVQQLNPQRNATRAEIAAMAYQAMALKGSASPIASGYVPAVASRPETPSVEAPSVEEPIAEEMGNQPTEITADLIASLESNDVAVQQAAAETLIEAGEAAVPELANALEADSAQTRAIAAYALNQIGPAAEAATPALLEVLRDDDELVRALATSALTQVGLEEPVLVNVLVAAVQNESGLVKDVAADALVEMGGEAIPELGRLLENKETSSIAKQTAATLIGDIGRADDLGSVALESAIPILASSLTNSDSSVRQAAASALGDFGPLAEIALPALSQTLLGQDVSVNQAIASTLLKIGPQSVPALTEALRSDNTLTRLYAADALWTLTENRDLVLPTLVAAAASNDFQTRELATLGIAYLGRQALPAVPFLNRLLGNSDSRTRNIARTALEIVGNNNRPSSTLGILEDQPRGLNAVPAVVEAITRLWR